MSSKGKYCPETRGQNYAWRKANPEKWAALKRRSYINNREKALIRVKDWYDKNRCHAIKMARVRSLKNEFGLTVDQYEEMIKVHDGKCAICEAGFTSTRNRHIDHSHSTGKVRGLLCTRCNLALGQVEVKNGQWLKKAVDYLQKSEEEGFKTWRWKG